MSYDPTSTEGVPEHGRERLAQMKGGFFTSDLSVNEFLLVKQAGFDPLGLVIGSSIYHVGYQQSNWNQNHGDGRPLAGDVRGARARDDADGGRGGPARRRRVVGVRLDVGRYEWGEHLAEFIAIGTAVKHHEGELHRAPNGRPFTSDLSGQDFWTLLCLRPPAGRARHGLMRLPRRPPGDRRRCRQVGQNVEMPNFTQALYDARELAMERMQKEAEELQAEGIVGVQLQERSHGWDQHVIEFFAVGTAVVPLATESRLPDPIPTISLND